MTGYSQLATSRRLPVAEALRDIERTSRNLPAPSDSAHTQEYDESDRTAPPGTAVRLDATGLTLAGRLTPWPNIAIEAVAIVTEYNPDATDSYHIEAVVLDMGGQSVVLGQGLITNGGRILDKVLLTLGVDFR